MSVHVLLDLWASAVKGTSTSACLILVIPLEHRIVSNSITVTDVCAKLDGEVGLMYIELDVIGCKRFFF